MNIKKKQVNLKSLWKTHNTTIVLLLLLIVFMGYTLFISFNLQRDIVPDEPYHYLVSSDFADSWGIPEFIPALEGAGVYIRQTPNLSYWLFGRALNLIDLIQPNASNWRRLVLLRLFNIPFAVGTLLFTYLLSKELIKNKWWQLLPVFVLSHTMMFVLLSSGVNYDNPANMFSTAGIYFLVRVLNKKNFLINSLSWIISISLGAWIKETILPLAFVMTVVWIIFIVKNKPEIHFSHFKQRKIISLITFLVILLYANFSIYGVNLIRHQSLTPSCSDYFTQEVCRSTALAVRRQQLALSEKPTMVEAVRQGYPEPIRYGFDTWIRAMLMKVYGVMGGQQSYYPLSITYYHILFYWMLALGIRYVKTFNYTKASLAGIFGFYALILFIKNYDIELAYGFIQVALQGRYIFPVISIIYGLFSYVLMKVPNKLLQKATLFVTMVLFTYGGPIRFFIHHNTIFTDWFI